MCHLIQTKFLFNVAYVKFRTYHISDKFLNYQKKIRIKKNKFAFHTLKKPSWISPREEYFSMTIFIAMQYSNLIEKKLQKNVFIQKHQNLYSDFRVYYLKFFGKVARNCHAPRHPGTEAPRHPGTLFLFQCFGRSKPQLLFSRFTSKTISFDLFNR